MDAAATAAGWLSFMVTAVGLGSLITQASAIQDRLDPYHTSRTEEHLGNWIKRQPKKAWNRLAQPTPIGPFMYAKLTDGFRGFNVIGVSRLPLEKPGKASWTALLAIFHQRAPSPVYGADTKTELATEHWRKGRLPAQLLLNPICAPVKNYSHGHLCRLVLSHVMVRQRAS